MKPILLFAFANDPENPLSALDAEQKLIREKLAGAVEEGLCEIKFIVPANIDLILDAFKHYPNQIAVFHFAGHAGSFELCLQAADGKKEIAHAEGFAEFLGLQRGLQLVFLNGCSTQAQVEGLLSAQVGAIIATSQAINDEIATGFSGRFYQSLGAGDGIQKSFQEAAAAIKMRKGSGASQRGLYYRSPAAAADRFPWDFYVGKGAETAREWNLPGAAGNPLFGLPKPPVRDLPLTPFRYLHWFQSEDAEVFYGRDYQIRELYDKIMAPDSPTIIHLYGRSGVGKSSLLAAGLAPRLEADHQVIYIRRNQEKGLVASLEAATGFSLPEGWKKQENALGRPLTIILDQAEEAFTRPVLQPGAADEPDQLIDLLVLLDLSRHRPKGKLILSYRKEYLAEFENRFAQARLAYGKCFIGNLQRNDILAAVTGLTKTPRTRERYGLQIEESLPEMIADDLLEDRDSPIAPVLQILLSKMWDLTPARDGKRMFRTTAYQSLKREGLLLNDFLHQKIEEIKTWNKEAVVSGLLLNLLLFHTTPKGTAARRSLTEIGARYPQRAKFLPQLIAEVKNRYLLVEVAAENGTFDLSLAHDTLAPILLEMAQISDLPAQKAERILAGKMSDWTPGDVANALDNAQLKAVEEGAWGMRALSEEEQKLVEASLERRKRTKRTRRRVIGAGILMILAIFGASVFAWIQKGMAETNAERAAQQARLATANSLSANSLIEQENNPTTAFRLADYALGYDSLSPRGYSALLQVFYSKNYYFEGGWHSSPFILRPARHTDRPAYRDAEYVIFPSSQKGDPDSLKQQVKTQIAQLLQGRNSSYFIKYDWEMQLVKAVYSPQKKFLLLVLWAETDSSSPFVEVWDLKNNHYRANWKEPYYDQYLSGNQADEELFSPANFSFDDRYLAIPSENKIQVVDLRAQTDPMRVAPDNFQIAGSPSEVLEVYFGRQDYLLHARNNREERFTWDPLLNPVPVFPFSKQSDVFTDVSGRFLISRKTTDVEIRNLDSGETQKGVITQDGKVRIEGQEMALLPLLDKEWHGVARNKDWLRDVSTGGQRVLSAESGGKNQYGTPSARVLDARGDTLITLKGHVGQIISVDISPDGRFYLTSACLNSGDPETTLWDAAGNEVFTLKGFGGKAGFLPGSRAFYTYLIECCVECDYANEFHIWPIDARQLIRQADQQGVVHLGKPELIQFGIDHAFIPRAGAAASDPVIPAAEKQPKLGRVTGSGVNLRAAPEVAGKKTGQLEKGMQVEILEIAQPTGDANTFVCKRPTILTLEDGSRQPLGNGKAVVRIEDRENGNKMLVEADVDGKVLRGTVPASDLRPMAGVSWYKVRSGNLTGWVYGDFLEEVE